MATVFDKKMLAQNSRGLRKYCQLGKKKKAFHNSQHLINRYRSAQCHFSGVAENRQRHTCLVISSSPNTSLSTKGLNKNLPVVLSYQYQQGATGMASWRIQALNWLVYVFRSLRVIHHEEGGRGAW